jgi:hypothetical protein
MQFDFFKLGSPNAVKIVIPITYKEHKKPFAETQFELLFERGVQNVECHFLKQKKKSLNQNFNENNLWQVPVN